MAWYKDVIGKIKSALYSGGKPVNPDVPNIVDERTPDAADDWVFGGGWMLFRSTDVDEARYLHDAKILEVDFLSGNLVQYYNVTEEEARGFYNTDSPGRYIWNVFRIPEREFAYITFAGKQERKGPNVVRELSESEKRKHGFI